ncbi:MAG: DUF3857 domain-containing protein [Bacteroidales bacterium]|nr:DUF3857 domain-containing protein [Bacteroidales bacterium]
MKITRLLFLIILSISIPITILADSIENVSFFGQTKDTLNNFSSRDATIINDSNSIIISGKKVEFIIFTITRKVRFKVNSEAGINKFSTFILPESFDPTYILHQPIESAHKKNYSDLQVNFFKATITKPNGEMIPAKINANCSIVKNIAENGEVYGQHYEYSYRIENLGLKDEITVEYNYEVKYESNFEKLSSFRIFFHGDTYKEQYHLRISLPSDLYLDIVYKNKGEPDSDVESNSRKVYSWYRKKLQGCISEKGSRPYLELPNIIFTIRPYGLRRNAYFIYDDNKTPLYLIMTSNRSNIAWGESASIIEGVKTKQTSLIDQFVKKETQNITTDSTGFEKLQKIHNTIVDNFEYEDSRILRKVDPTAHRVGEYLMSNKIRESNRYAIYYSIFAKMNWDASFIFLCDKRCGEIDNDYFVPIYDSDYIFGVWLKNNNLLFIHPKRASFGYYLNEFPFYHENIWARLFNYEDFMFYRTVSTKLNQVITPSSNLNSNSRMSNIMVTVNVNALSAVFDARINVSGQYSTLTRGLYQWDVKDETINTIYNKRIWELNPQVKLISKKVLIKSKDYPFQAIINTQYKADNIIQNKNDTLSINLKNWFNHIIYTGFDTLNRQLDFYPDFKGKDTYVYLLKFDKNVRLLNAPVDVSITNELGELTILFEQPSPDALKISSYYSVVSPKISRSNIRAVKELYEKIESLNNSTIIFTVE